MERWNSIYGGQAWLHPSGFTIYGNGEVHPTPEALTPRDDGDFEDADGHVFHAYRDLVAHGHLYYLVGSEPPRVVNNVTLNVRPVVLPPWRVTMEQLPQGPRAVHVRYRVVLAGWDGPGPQPHEQPAEVGHEYPDWPPLPQR